MGQTMQQLMDMEDRYGVNNYGPHPVVMARGEGVYLIDVDGKRYIDWVSAYSAQPFGHCPEDILKVKWEQEKRLWCPARYVRNDQAAPFLQKITEFTGMDKFMPGNSGVEAVIGGIKAARRWGYRVKGIEADKAELIVAMGNFHGRDFFAISASDHAEYKDGFGPHLPGIVKVPYNDAPAVEKAITPNTCAVLVEPFQGEGGMIFPDAGYLTQLRSICDKNNVKLFFDEVQTGFCRTGKHFGYFHDGVKPDIMSIGKALGGGVQIASGTLMSNEIAELFEPGSHGSTFAGNPVSYAVGSAVIDRILRDKCDEVSAEMGEYTLKALQAKLDNAHIKDIRMKGLFGGIDLDLPATPVCRTLLAEGISCNAAHDQTIRLSPPLTITKEEIDASVECFAKVLNAL